MNPSNDKQASKKQSKSSKNYINNSQYSLNPSSKSGSVLAMAREYLQSTSTSHTSYNDDYNAVYLSEFRSTICFQEWAKVNRSNLETKLFQMTETDSISESNEMITQFDQLDLKFNQDGMYYVQYIYICYDPSLILTQVELWMLLFINFYFIH